MVGLLLVRVDWFDCFCSSFRQLGLLMILAWVDDSGFSLRLVVMALWTPGNDGCWLVWIHWLWWVWWLFWVGGLMIFLGWFFNVGLMIFSCWRFWWRIGTLYEFLYVYLIGKYKKRKSQIILIFWATWRTWRKCYHCSFENNDFF